MPDIIYDALSPLATAPGRESWERFRGEKYVVFVDESFYRFFDFSHVDGNFVHGAVGLPESRYAAFKDRFAPLLEQYFAKCDQALRPKSIELKHTDFKRLPFPFRRKLLLTLNGMLDANGGFIAGFFTSNKGVVMEKIREDLLDTAKSVPENYGDLYDEKVKSLNAREVGPGRSAQIVDLLLLPISAVGNMLAAFDSRFRIVYDPRHPDEDQAVVKATDGYKQIFENMPSALCVIPFDGIEADATSESELGLQIADLVAGQVRDFFRSNAELLSYGSGLELVTSDSDEPLEEWKELEGRRFKRGRIVTIPPHIQKRYLNATEDCTLPYLRKVIASGCLTCITEFGQQRLIRLFQGNALDQCD